jgi:hypothetical protein
MTADVGLRNDLARCILFNLGRWYQHNGGINRRAINAGADKLSMKGELTRVRVNDLLSRGRP